MSDVEQVAELAPAPELETTAVTPEPVVETPEVAAKTFSQEELDAAIGKRLAREQRKWERERQPAPVVAVDLPPQDQFESVDAYAEAKAYKLIEQRELQKQQAEILDGYHEREETARSKYSDFEQVAYNPNLKITTVMAQTIQSSDIGPDLVYHLGSNPKEADRISRLAPILQAKEIGRLEVSVKHAARVQIRHARTRLQQILPRLTFGKVHAVASVDQTLQVAAGAVLHDHVQLLRFHK